MPHLLQDFWMKLKTPCLQKTGPSSDYIMLIVTFSNNIFKNLYLQPKLQITYTNNKLASLHSVWILSISNKKFLMQSPHNCMHNTATIYISQGPMKVYLLKTLILMNKYCTSTWCWCVQCIIVCIHIYIGIYKLYK